MLKIYLLRHGETLWNTEQRLQGQQDSPLTEKGKRQAEQNGERLRGLLTGEPFRVVSSPLGRTMITAKIVAAKLGITEDQIEREARLQEISFGDWEGMTKDEIRDSDRERYESRWQDRWNVRSPGGENYQDVTDRLQSWLSELNEGTYVVISHGGAGKLLRAIHANLGRDEIPGLSENHETIFLLSEGGSIERV